MGQNTLLFPAIKYNLYDVDGPVPQFLYIHIRKNEQKNPFRTDHLSAEEIYLKICGSTLQMDKTRWTKDPKALYRKALLPAKLVFKSLMNNYIQY
jgi:hypothetical protein